MEREQEIAKLVNVLHRIARAATFSLWVKTEPEAVKFCATQYNKILSRLKELEPNIASVYGQLSEDASAEVVRMAAHDLAAYFEDEPGVRAHHRHGRRHCRPHHVAFAWSHAARRCS